MEERQLTDLKHPAWNPRRIQEFDFDNLTNSISEFGDLSPVVRNNATGNIVGGNQRVEAFKRLSTNRIVITQRFDQPTNVGTVAHGYIVMPSGEQYAYREVLWPIDAQDQSGQPYSSKEKAANVAANHITGQDDKELLAKLDYELSLLDNGAELLALTGQREKDIEDLLQSIGVGEEPEQEPDADEPDNKLTFALSPDQKAYIEQVLAHVKATNSIPHTNLDNINGTALYIICQVYAKNAASQNIAPTQEGPAVQEAEPLDGLPTVA